MKVLFISHEDSKYGAPKSLMEMLLTLKTNYDVEPIVLLHSKDYVYEFCQKHNIEKHVVGHRNIICGKRNDIKSYFKWIPKNIINRMNDYTALRYVKRNINMSDVDIIHSNVTITTLGMLLSKEYSLPHIVHLRESANIVENYLQTRNLIRCLRRGADYFIAISEFNKQEWIKRGLPKEKIKTIYNGLNLFFSKNLKGEYSKNNRFKIVFSGALTQDKGQIDLIEAINILPEKYKAFVHVDFIGEGNKLYTKILKEKVQSYGLDSQISFLGYVKNANEKYSSYNIGIVGSRAEAFGRVTVEYMASGLCVIATNAGANPELIQDGVNGYLYSVGDYRMLSKRICYVFDCPHEIKKVGIEAEIYANNLFSTKRNANEIYNLYSFIKKRDI